MNERKTKKHHIQELCKNYKLCNISIIKVRKGEEMLEQDTTE